MEKRLADFEERLERLERAFDYFSTSVRFIAVATPLVLGVATFVVLVTR